VINLPTIKEKEYDIFYKKLNQVGEAVDVLKHAHDNHPFTFGYNGEGLPEYDQVLTAKEEIGSRQTLDYIFEIKPNLHSYLFNGNGGAGNSRTSSGSHNNKKDVVLFVRDERKIKLIENNNNEKEIILPTNGLSTENGISGYLEVDYTTAKVESFLIKNKPYQQLSDHFGLSVELKYCEYNGLGGV
jgi:hypothetical protein